MKYLKILLIILLFVTICTINSFGRYNVLANSTFQYFQPLIISVNDIIPDNYSVSFSFDHKALVSSGKSLVSGDDIRIFYDQSGSFSGEQIELDRVLDERSSWNLTNTKVWFKLKTGIASSDIDGNHYRLYYGNSSASVPPQNKSDVYEYFDDFEDSNMSNWTIDGGGWSESNGVLKSESGGAQVRNNKVSILDSYIEVKINKINSGQYVGIFNRSSDLNHFYLFDRDGNASDWRLYRNYDGWTLLGVTNNFSQPHDNDILSLKIIGNLIVAKRNDETIFIVRDDVLHYNQVGLFTNGPNSYTEFDNFLVRKAVENEPVVTLGEEMTPSPTLTPTNTPTPTFTPTPTLTFTPTPTPIPDTTPPKVQKAETQDLDKDGKIDAVRLIFSEPILDSSFPKDTQAGFDVKGYDNEKLNTGTTENDDILLLSFSEKEKNDTDREPITEYKNGTVTDWAGNKLGNFRLKAADKALPVLLSAQTRDTNNNNKIDKIMLNFSEALNKFSVSKEDFVISTPAYTINSVNVKNRIITLLVNESSYFDTGAKPTIIVKKASIEDQNSNFNEEKSLTAMDKVKPYLWLGDLRPDKSDKKVLTITGLASDFSPSQDSIVTHVVVEGKMPGQADWQEIVVLNNDELTEPFVFGPYAWQAVKKGKYEVRVTGEDLAGNLKSGQKSVNIN